MYLSSASDIVDESVLTVPDHTTLNQLRELISHSGAEAKFVALTNSLGRFAGFLKHPLKSIAQDVSDLRAFTAAAPIVRANETSAIEVVKFMIAKRHDEVALESDRRFVGLITRTSVLNAFGELVTS